MEILNYQNFKKKKNFFSTKYFIELTYKRKRG
jgi:hypothetical protein